MLLPKPHGERLWLSEGCECVSLWTPTRVERRLKCLYLAFNHPHAWTQCWTMGRRKTQQEDPGTRHQEPWAPAPLSCWCSGSLWIKSYSLSHAHCLGEYGWERHAEKESYFPFLDIACIRNEENGHGKKQRSYGTLFWAVHVPPLTQTQGTKPFSWLHTLQASLATPWEDLEPFIPHIYPKGGFYWTCLDTCLVLNKN